MRVSIHSLEAHQRDDVVIVIDVFRAFTTTSVALEAGASEVLFVEDPETALALRAAGRVEFSLGERGGRRVEGFDYGNSPAQLRAAPLAGARLALTTSNGTRGLLEAARAGAGRIFAAALVNAGATARAVAALSPPSVGIVAMGRHGTRRTDEDELCALLLRARLEGRQPDPRALSTLLESLAPAPDPALMREGHYHPDDRQIAMTVDLVDIAVEVDRAGAHLRAGPAVAEPDLREGARR
jgi:2-phosphosulfolactate phosphatase